MLSPGLIVTKLNPPILNRLFVPRVRLMNRLSSECTEATKLILLHAPVGFGKTTLSLQWIEHRRHVCWYSLDERDSDGRLFLKYFIAGLANQGVLDGEEALNQLNSRASENFDDCIRIIINGIDKFGESVCFILDDFHLIQGSQVENILMELLHYVPNNFQLFISSRTCPNLDIPGMRIEGTCLEISGDDLRFNCDETKDFLVTRTQESVSSVLAQELTEKTEGWGAGLQLALMSRPNDLELSQFVRSFSGADQVTVQYLTENIFKKMDEETQGFLLRTCILERFNTQVATELSGVEESENILRQLESSGLFIVQLDENRTWYRYHHLIKEFLLEQLRRDRPEKLVALYQRAYEWFLNKNFAEEALSYALEAGNIDGAMSLVKTLMDKSVTDGTFVNVQSWIKRIPPQYYQAHPSLLVYYCTALTHMGLCKQSAYWLEQLTIGIDREALETPEKCEWTRFRGDLSALNMLNLVLSDELDAAKNLYPVKLPEKLQIEALRGGVHNVNAVVHMCFSEFDRADHEITLARQCQYNADCNVGIIYSYCFEALKELEQLRLYSAQHAIDRAEMVIKERGLSDKSSTAALIKIPKAAVMYAWNQVGDARDLITRYLPLVEECSLLEIRNMAFIILARICHLDNDLEAALNLLDRSLEANQECSLEFSQAQVYCEKIQFFLASNRADEAHYLLRKLGLLSSEPTELPKKWDRVQCIKIYAWCVYKVYTNPCVSAVPVLVHMRKLAHTFGRYRRMLDIMLLEVKLLRHLEQTEAAIALLGTSLEWAEKEDYLRVYLDHGEEIGELLRELLKLNKLSVRKENFIQKIFMAFDATVQRKYLLQPQYVAPELYSERKDPELAVRFTRRELSILELLDQGFPNKKIATNLFISPNTVSWYITGIFKKLKVSNRTQAVAAARKIRLLDTDPVHTKPILR